MRAALTMDVLATDLADYLVRKGVSFLLSNLRLLTPWISRFLFERRIIYQGVQSLLLNLVVAN